MGESAVHSLVQALKNDGNIDVRMSAARALGRIGEPAKEAVPTLIQALEDQDFRVRNIAVWALVQIGKPAVPHLIQVLENEKQADVHSFAVEVLEQMSTPEAKRALKEYKKKSQ